ncbi:MAG: hypothetical protein J2P57_05830 [Acidimicrobiaceae bacterium]|nr:hypothetical protein [Acidimicrobiaceae bacterium]
MLAFVVLAIAIPNSPGRINADTEGMISEVRSGHITDWHSAMLEVVFRPFVNHLPIGFFFACQTIVLVGATLAIARCHIRPVAARLLVVVLWLNPLGYSFAADFTRDVWVLVGVGATIACYEWMLITRRRGQTGRLPMALTALSILFTLASRQNAAALLAPLAAAVVWKRYGEFGVRGFWPVRPRHASLASATPSGDHGAARPRLRKRILVTTGATIIVLLVPIIALTELQPLFGVKKTGPQTAIMVRDLVIYSLYTGKVEVPASAHSPGLTVQDIERYGSFYNPDQLFYGTQPARVYEQLPAKARTQVRKAWTHLVTHHTVTYLKARTHLFLRQIAFTGPTRDTYLPLEVANNVGLRSTHPPQAKLATEYMKRASTPQTKLGQWLTRTWLWLLLALAAGLIAWRRGRPALALTLAAWLYVISYFFGATAIQFRFPEPSVIICMGVVLSLIATEVSQLTDRMRSRRRADTASP